MIEGQGAYRYELVEGWGQERKLGVVSSVATDSQDRVYVIDREPHAAIVVFDREGSVLASWGEDIFTLPHGIWIGPDDQVYIADCTDHTVRICTTEGQVVRTLGTPGQAGAPGMPFNQPTRAAGSPSGDIYVSDGYGQHRMHRFSPDGTLKLSWGEKGPGPGQLSLPHGVFVAGDGRVLVADRQPNNRICVFDAEGVYLTAWPIDSHPNDVYVDADGTVYTTAGRRGVSIFDRDGSLLSSWPVRRSSDSVTYAPHSIWVDSRGDIYVGEVGAENRLHKYARVAAEETV